MFLLLLFAVLLEQTLELKPSSWRIIDLPVAEADMELDARFAVTGDDKSRISGALVTRQDALRFEQGRNVKPISSTNWAHEGRIRHVFRHAGNYALILDNRIEAKQPVAARVKVDLMHYRDTQVRELPRERRILVITVSLLIFVAIVMFTARQFAR